MSCWTLLGPSPWSDPDTFASLWNASKFVNHVQIQVYSKYTHIYIYILYQYLLCAAYQCIVHLFTVVYMRVLLVMIHQLCAQVHGHDLEHAVSKHLRLVRAHSTLHF